MSGGEVTKRFKAGHRAMLGALLMATTGLAGVAATPALAQSAEQRSFNIPAQSLREALLLFSQQSGLQVTAQGPLVEGRTSAVVSGNLSPAAALSQLLAGTGLTFRFDGRDAVQIELAPKSAEGSIQLGPVRVEGAAGSGSGNVVSLTSDPAATEGTGSYTNGVTSTATKLNLSIRETPQSVTVVTRQRMDDQNLQSLEDVAKAVAGITTTKGYGSQRPVYHARGFLISDVQYDGLPSSVSESYSLDVVSFNNMAIYDRAEIVRGANGLLQGAGSPSVAINLVRKRPTKNFQLNAEVSAGSWDNYRAQLDIGGPLNEQGTLRARTVLMYNNADSYKDYEGKNNLLFYAIGEADLGERTTISAGITLQKDDTPGYDWGGLPRQTNGQPYDLPRSASFSGDWAHLNRNNHSVFADFKHYFSDDWKITIAGKYIWSDADFFSQIGYNDVGDNLLRLQGNRTYYDDRQIGIDAVIDGNFELFGKTHEIIVGASTRRDRFKADFYNEPRASHRIVDIFDYTGSQPVNFGTNNSRTVREEKGAFLATRLNPIDNIHVILGSRFSWVAYDTSSTVYKENGKFIPYAGIVYDIGASTSIYASYTEIFNFQTNFSVENNELLDPIIGSNYEIGAKKEFLDGRVNASFALFQIEQSHMPEAVTTVDRICGPTNSSRCYIDGGKVRSRGVDVEVNGEILPGWNVSLGYTYNRTKYVAGNLKGNDYNSASAPRNLLKLATTYQFRGALENLRLGGSVYHQGRVYISDADQDAYTLVDINAHYKFNENFSAQLNVNNIFDKTYWAGIEDAGYGNYYGAPRNFNFTLRFKY